MPSYFKIFSAVLKLWSGHESVTDRLTDGGISYNPLPDLRKGISKPQLTPKCDLDL